jgi:DNA-binding response OmpR family regulator
MSNVMVVEDDRLVAELIEEALVDERHEVAVAHDDRTAYARLEGEPRSFEVLIADIDLGEGTTGFDVARRARQLNPEVKVIYISGSPAHVDRFGVEGAVVFQKPFSPVELARVIAPEATDGATGDPGEAASWPP